MKIKKKFIMGILIIIAIFLIYVIWDNNRIVIKEENVVIDDLPKELEDFTILQITDLHEKKFGVNQSRLIKAINSQDYDAIVFTGDMLDNSESTNYQPFYSILEGIEDRENMLAVPGNADSPSYQISPHFQKSKFVRGLEKRGVRYLESFETLQVDGEKIHFVNFELSIIENPQQIGKVNGSFQSVHASDQSFQSYHKSLWDEMRDEDILDSSDILIGLNHYPIPDARVDYIQQDPHTTWNHYDLIIAGHYHGGQIRLPFIGALFIPEPWYEPNSFFPPQDRVKGLWEYKRTKQYVSAGLGNSDAIPLLKFRLFNPPEINVLRLKHE